MVPRMRGVRRNEWQVFRVSRTTALHALRPSLLSLLKESTDDIGRHVPNLEGFAVTG